MVKEGVFCDIVRHAVYTKLINGCHKGDHM